MSDLEGKTTFSLPSSRSRELRLHQLAKFAGNMIDIANKIGFRLSARGWAYQLEGFHLITKAEFDRVENIINECRQNGLLPIDFTAEEESRQFSGVEKPTKETPIAFMGKYLEASLRCEDWYTPDWWDGETVYIQMVVEKIDLKTLFQPICEAFHIPIATSKGWSSMLQRAEYSRRFKEAEARGLKCVLLYCGDHDPDGLRISEFLRSNLRELAFVRWNDGVRGYNPSNLTIERFGLNYDFIEANNLSWIDNLYTGSGRNLADPSHPSHNMPYVQEYLEKYGERKCEANALVVIPKQARTLCYSAIVKYAGEDALERFKAKFQKVKDELDKFREEKGLTDVIQEALDIINEQEGGADS